MGFSDRRLRRLEPLWSRMLEPPFLLATVRGRSCPEGCTALYVAEKACHESWKVVDAGLDPESPWRPIVANWAGEAFAGCGASLEEGLDGLAAGAGEDG